MKGIFIFVCDRGFVFAAEAEFSSRLVHHWHAPLSRTIRKWGTTEGLAQLKDGPIEGSTVLDAVCERFIPVRSIIDIIVPTPEGQVAWKEALMSWKNPS